MRLRRFVQLLLLVLLLAGGLLLLNNNVSAVQPSKAEFRGKLDAAQANVLDWVEGRGLGTAEYVEEQRLELLSNIYHMYFLLDSGAMAGDSRFQVFLAARRRVWSLPDYQLRIVDPTSPFVVSPKDQWEKLLDYQRWCLYAVSPGDVQLTPEDKADMFTPDKYHRGRLTHQLLAVNLYRQRNGTTPELERLIRRLGEGIAAEASIDFRVTDLYLQRISFLLFAGMPDLVKPRWVERALNAQQPDGGWTYTWYGWDERFWHWRLPEEESTAHPSAQGLWMIYLLKYRYPQWIEQHYR